MKKAISLLASVALLASTTASFAWNTPPYVHHPKPPKAQPPHQTQGHNTTGQWVVGCGFGAASGLMVGSAYMHGKQQRQLTVTEAAWAAGIGCPFLLPLALLAQSRCPDNAKTYKVARAAFLAQQRDPQADMAPFTKAYGEACKGK